MSVRKAITWAFSGQIFNFVIAFGGSVAVARLLSPQEMGVVAIGMATLAIIAIVTSFGTGAYVIREPTLSPQVLDAACTINALLAVLLSAALVTVSLFAEPLLGDAAAGEVLRILAIGPLIGIFSFKPQMLLQREMQFRTLTLVSSVAIVLATATTLGAALLGFSYYSPTFGGLASALVSVAMHAVLNPRYMPFRVSFHDWRRMTTFGLRMMSVSGVSSMAMRLSDVVLGRLLGLTALGLYSRAANLSNMVFENIYGTATRVVFAQLSKDFRETGELRATFLRGFQMITAVMWPLLIGLAVLSGPIIYLLYGSRWLGAALPLSLLMIAQFLSLCFGMNWELFVLRDETARQTKYEVTRSVFGLVVFTIGSLFSIAGAAIGRIVDAGFGLIMYYPHMRRLAKTEPGEIPGVYRESGLLTAAAVLPSFILMMTHDWAADTPFWQVAGAVLVGVALWLATVHRLDHPLLGELRIFLRKAKTAVAIRPLFARGGPARTLDEPPIG